MRSATAGLSVALALALGALMIVPVGAYAQGTGAAGAIAPAPDAPVGVKPSDGTVPATGASVSSISPVLTLDQDRLFAASAWGKRAEAAVQAASVALAAENRKIEADLAAEEKALTDKRSTMTPEAFRAEADAFDARVVAFRNAQGAKARDIGAMRDAERKAFFSAVLPAMAEVMKDRGAVAILDARAIFVSVNAIDVTDQMIARSDATIGAGTPPAPKPVANPEPISTPSQVPAPAPEPEPGQTPPTDSSP